MRKMIFIATLSLITLAVFVAVVIPIASLWPMYIRSDVRSDVNQIYSDIRSRTGLGGAKDQIHSLMCSSDMCWMVLRQSFVTPHAILPESYSLLRWSIGHPESYATMAHP
jgi:hypothetical protein